MVWKASRRSMARPSSHCLWFTHWGSLCWLKSLSRALLFSHFLLLDCFRSSDLTRHIKSLWVTLNVTLSVRVEGIGFWLFDFTEVLTNFWFPVEIMNRASVFIVGIVDSRLHMGVGLFPVFMSFLQTRGERLPGLGPSSSKVSWSRSGTLPQILLSSRFLRTLLRLVRRRTLENLLLLLVIFFLEPLLYGCQALCNLSLDPL